MKSTLLMTGMVLGAVLLLGWFGPTLDDNASEWGTSDAIEKRYHDAEATARYEKAVTDLCGPQAAWVQLEGNDIQCYTKRGAKTKRVTVQR